MGTYVDPGQIPPSATGRRWWRRPGGAVHHRGYKRVCGTLSPWYTRWALCDLGGLVFILLTTPHTLSIRLCFFVPPQLDRVDFVMGFVVQLVMEFVEIGNRGEVHGKGSSAGKLLGN